VRKNILAKRIVFYEWIGFGTVILFLWLDELLDLPNKLFNAEMTPVNWIPIDEYVGEHSDAEFSHSFCPECLKKYYGK